MMTAFLFVEGIDMSITTTFAQRKRSGRHGFLRIVFGYLALVLALAACGTTSTSTTGAGPVTMAVLSCFTSTLASLRQAMLQRSQAAQQAIADAGGIIAR